MPVDKFPSEGGLNLTCLLFVWQKGINAKQVFSLDVSVGRICCMLKSLLKGVSFLEG